MNDSNKLVALILCVVALALFPATGTSQTDLLAWDFDGKIGNEAQGIASTIDNEVSDQAPSGVLKRGPGILPDSTDDSFSSTGWSVDMDFDPASTDYLEFTIAPKPDPSHRLDITSIEIYWQGEADGPTTLALTSSFDDHAAAEETAVIAGNLITFDLTDNTTGFDNLSEPVTFRIYGYGATDPMDSGQLKQTGMGDDLVVRGMVTSCGIGSVGPVEVTCNTNSNFPEVDGVTLSIPFIEFEDKTVTITALVVGEESKGLFIDGIEGQAMIMLDEPADIVEITGLIEGQEYLITVNEGECNYTFTGIVPSNFCTTACAIATEDPIFTCDAVTEGVDAVTVAIPYTGAENGTTVTPDARLIYSGDPLAAGDGTIELTGAAEGSTYSVSLANPEAECLTVLTFTIPADLCTAVSNRPFISEFVYDNAGSEGTPDLENFVEIALPTTGTFAGIDPADVQILLYDGATGSAYNAVVLTPAMAGTPAQGYQYYTWMEMDPALDLIDDLGGIALVVEGVLIEFISYEGSFTGETGFAGGVRSTDVGADVDLDETDPVGNSIQRFGDCSGENISCPDGLIWDVFPNTKGQVNTGAILPITLQSFTASAERETVVLEWITATERDNDYFVIERSADGRSFTSIGRVAGKGSTELETKYGFVDASPLSGRGYYRLRQVDFDGTTAYFGPVAVDFSGTGTVPVRVYPNPNRTGSVTLEGGLQSGTRVSLLDVDGRILRQWTMVEEQLRRELSLTGIIPGIYFLRLEDGRDVRTVRFVRQ